MDFRNSVTFIYFNNKNIQNSVMPLVTLLCEYFCFFVKVNCVVTLFHSGYTAVKFCSYVFTSLLRRVGMSSFEMFGVIFLFCF